MNEMIRVEGMDFWWLAVGSVDSIEPGGGDLRFRNSAEDSSSIFLWQTPLKNTVTQPVKAAFSVYQLL